MTAIAPTSSPLFQAAAGNGRLDAGAVPAGATEPGRAQSGARAARDKSAAGSAGAASIAQLSAEQQRQVAKLAARDREVRAHEAAHANVGGVHAGAPRYSYTRGPDGRNYAVSGEVSIDLSPVAGDPQATINKAQLVRRAALAPAEPSAQDRSVANQAVAMEQQARAELQAQKRADGEARGLAGFGSASIAVTGASAPGEIIDELI